MAMARQAMLYTINENREIDTHESLSTNIKSQKYNRIWTNDYYVVLTRSLLSSISCIEQSFVHAF